MITLPEFKKEALEGLSRLSDFGFNLRPDLARETETHGSIVYFGRNVAFTFKFDVRTQIFQSGVQGASVELFSGNAALPRELYSFLVHSLEYRGSPEGAGFDFTSHDATKIREVVQDWFHFVESHAPSLLRDDEGLFETS